MSGGDLHSKLLTGDPSRWTREAMSRLALR